MENILVYHRGDISAIILSGCTILIIAFAIGFIIPRFRKGNLKDLPGKVYIMAALAAALFIATQCFLKLFDLIGYKFEIGLIGTTESTAWAPILTIITIEMIAIIYFACTISAFSLGKRLKKRCIAK